VEDAAAMREVRNECLEQQRGRVIVITGTTGRGPTHGNAIKIIK